MMSEASDPSDTEMSDKQDDKDADFNVDDYCHEMDSDDSFAESLENNVNVNVNNPQDKSAGPVISGHRFDKKLVCVKYPGNVVNVDKAIETLGGISSISMTVDVPNRRLELRFRPDDGYSKPTCGDRHSTNGFLLRVRIKKNKVTQVKSTTVELVKPTSVDITNSEASTSCIGKDLHASHSEDEQISVARENIDREGNSVVDLVSQEEERSVDPAHCSSEAASAEKVCAAGVENLCDTCVDKCPSKRNKDTFTFDNNKYENLSKETNYELPRLKILGRIETEFKFTNLCDFQYIPMTQNRSDPKKLECIYSLIYPTGIPLYSWLRNDVPYFLPPAVFSRMDTIQQYIPKTELDSNSENVIGKSKKSQAGFPNYIYFSTSEVPSAAPKGIETAMRVKFLQNTHLEQVRQLFEERPIWSKNAIMYKTQFTSEQLKILLPSVAYYFMTGPWRIMWVKLGYDPRKDINARKYQTLDYRLKAMHGLGSTVKCKRNYANYTLPYKSAPVSKQKPAVLTATVSQEQTSKKERHLYENVYIYREGMVPPSRQMFYQYCDVLVGEIQEMLAKLPDPLPGIRCHEKRGWLPTGFDVQCREILNKQVRAVLRKRMNIPEDHPTSLPRKRKRGIKLKYNKMVNKSTKKDTTNSTEI
ncbi:PREDICTED: general transcription factor 3C polypeptide 5 [Vollenhovia emeryi]|uniref:general transcription factor 3C polypeptide 5 n=1 Tax=Vollenhovia emeryi TaxID=411798 RepID=UPI0005F50525|nr:PREDICTED: general transcription factor 3C polypeptide 5 [Vollenhovia emeryi]XP_011874304.1 PREDICTED: general transcription factor 3C polypeptide 5 [Vollenhovia emeryi]XP_011874305.1 PREDICTED: general transcription factor 3C polypeptide 5 [Vollenhovia emeryi]